jgi:oligoendopeptidase F
MSAAPLAPPSARWNLSALFSGVDDPKIVETWAELQNRADAFAEAYRGTIDSPHLDAKTLVQALAELESIASEASKPMNFGELLFAADTSDATIGAFLQAQREHATELQIKLIFFELELMSAPEERIAELMRDFRLENYRHYLGVVRTYAPHRLSEPEEIILEETANTGVRAWVRLFEEVTSNHEFRYFDPEGGEVRHLSQEEVLTLLREPDRRVRQAAADAFTDGLRELSRVVTFTFNTLLQDKSVGDRLRSHPYPEHSRHLANELDRETVELVVR